LLAALVVERRIAS